MNPSTAMLTMLGLAAVGQAFECSAPLPFMVHHDLNDRHLAGGTDNQCFNETKVTNDEIEGRGASFTVHIQCSDFSYCEIDARENPLYNDFLAQCNSLNGHNYSYNIHCDFVFTVEDLGSQQVTVRWNNMTACFAPVCNTTEVIEALSDLEFTQTDSLGGAQISSGSCFIYYLRDWNGTTIKDRFDLDVTIGSSATCLSLIASITMVLFLSILFVTPVFIF